ncbi:MAG: DUF86 domain-containing protein [SAR202 cluster bacterium]|jgi:uncharacterized protein with HEPN domain|nr:DUF86 domain-containing protein [SAR202 cluster bacterium]MDP6513919.1 DUF86 domain-containing protein [SAR202 cluster bacterium]MDP6714225.1 DUF86 domain-containing protein [SAR202 cluster bacterium]
MQRESQKFLYDIQQASDLIARITDGKTFEVYANDEILRPAVEREFGIIGEAINQLSRVDSATVARITNFRRIIDFRNFLIHAYDQIDDDVVWDIVTNDLPILLEDIRQILQENGDT